MCRVEIYASARGDLNGGRRKRETGPVCLSWCQGWNQLTGGGECGVEGGGNTLLACPPRQSKLHVETDTRRSDRQTTDGYT